MQRSRLSTAILVAILVLGTSPVLAAATPVPFADAHIQGGAPGKPDLNTLCPHATDAQGKPCKPSPTVDNGLLSVKSPKQEGVLLGDSAQIDIQIAQKAERETLSARLNGKDVTSRFTTRLFGETARLTQADGLKDGTNVLHLEIQGWNNTYDNERIRFRWSPTAITAEDVPPIMDSTYNLTTLTPGGMVDNEPWFAINTYSLHGVSRTYPANPTVCGGNGFAYTMVIIDRATLAEVSTTCFQAEIPPTTLNQALSTIPSNQFAVFGTNAGFNVVPGTLNLQPIGGSDFSTDPTPTTPQGLMAIGIGHAQGGVAIQSYNMLQDVAPPPVQLNLLLTMNSASLFDAHPSDNVIFTVDGPNGTVTVNGTTYSRPSKPTSGFWVFSLTRQQLVLSPPMPPCTPASDGTTQCGAVFDASVATDLSAMTQLLQSLSWRDLIFVVGWGNNPGGDSPAQIATLGGVLAGLGVPFYTYQEMTGDASVFAAVLSYGFEATMPNRQAITSLAVDPSNIPSGGQTAQIVGALKRDFNDLYAPVAGTQTDLAEAAPFDLSFIQTVWRPNSPWPLMDTTGRVNAYRYLSYTVFQNGWGTSTPNVNLDDIRRIYTSPTDNYVLFNLDPTDTTKYPYPASGSFTYNGTTYAFSAQDLSDVATQLKKEFEALKIVVPNLGTGQGAALQTLLIGSAGSGAIYSLFGAVSGALADINAPDATVKASVPNILNFASGILSIGATFDIPATGLVSAVLKTLNSLGMATQDDSGLPTPDYVVQTTASDLASNYQTYLGNANAAYAVMMDSVLSDWNKLSAVQNGFNGPWYMSSYTALSTVTAGLTDGAKRYFYTSLISALYYHDTYFVTHWTSAGKIGSWQYQCVEGICNPTGCEALYTSFPANADFAFPSFPQAAVGYTNKWDVYTIAGAISNNRTMKMSEVKPSAHLVDTLFGDVASGNLGMPADLWVTMGPLPQRTGTNTPQWSDAFGNCDYGIDPTATERAKRFFPFVTNENHP